MMGCAMLSRTAGDIAAEVLMVRGTTAGPFLIVEGPSDERFFAPRVVGNCYIAIGSGKKTVLDTIDVLEQDRSGATVNFVGVVDEDYDWLIGYTHPSTNLIKTDPRDLEGLLFRSGAVQSVLAEYADRAAVAAFEARGQTVVEAILERAEPFGRIRMVNSRGPLVDLSSFKPIRFCDRATWTYDIARAKLEAVRLGVAATVGELDTQMNALTPPSQWHCVRGHDLVDIFHCGLLQVLGSATPDRPGIERLLRQAFSQEEFSRTALHADLLRWSGRKVAVLG